MTEDTIVNVWNEVRLTADGISITLFSETATGGAIVEDETWYTFEELQEQSPNPPQSLNLSPETRSKLSEQSEAAAMASLDEVLSSVEPDNIVEDAQSENLPEVGDILRDENAADWSDEHKVEVLNVLEDTTCDEYVIQSNDEDRVNTEVDEPRLLEKTVSDANPSYDPHDPVVIARYLDSRKEYAFPASRLQ